MQNKRSDGERLVKRSPRHDRRSPSLASEVESHTERSSRKDQIKILQATGMKLFSGLCNTGPNMDEKLGSSAVEKHGEMKAQTERATFCWWTEEKRPQNRNSKLVIRSRRLVSRVKDVYAEQKRLHDG